MDEKEWWLGELLMTELNHQPENLPKQDDQKLVCCVREDIVNFFDKHITRDSLYICENEEDIEKLKKKYKKNQKLNCFGF